MSKKPTGKSAMPEKMLKKVQHVRGHLPEVPEEAIIQALNEHDSNAEKAIRALKQTDPGDLAFHQKTTKRSAAAQATPAAEETKKPAGRSRDDARGRGGGGNVGATTGPRRSPRRSPPRGQDEAPPYELRLQIDPSRYGVIVGKAGVTMNKINDSYSVKLDVPGRGETGAVTIRGKKEDCERAQKYLEKILGGESIEVASRRAPRAGPTWEKPGPKMGGKVIQARRTVAGAVPATTGAPASVSFRAALTSGGAVEHPPTRTPPPEEADEYPPAGTPPASKAHMRHSPARAEPPVAGEEARPIREKKVQRDVPQGRDHVAAPRPGARASVQLRPGCAWTGATVVRQDQSQIIVRADKMAVEVPLPLDRVRPAEGDTWAETGREDAPSPPPPEHEPAEAEKLREVFNFMDSAGRGLVTLREFCAAMEHARVILGDSPLIQKLYDKLAGDESSGQIGFANFRQLMPDHYPLLLDALYWRPREVGVDARERDVAAAARRQFEKYQSEEGGIRKRLDEANNEVRQQEKALRDQEMYIEDSTRREADLNEQLNQLDRTYNANQESVARREQEQRNSHEREKLAHASKRQAESSCEEYKRQLRVQEEATRRAVDKLNELKRQLAEQQKEVDRLRGLDDKVAGQLAKEKQKVQTAITDAEDAKDKASGSQEGLRRAEAEMQKVVQRRKEQEGALKRAKEDTLRQKRQAEYEVAELEKRKAAEQQLSEELAKVTAHMSEQATHLREIEEQEAQRRKEQVEDEKGDNDNIQKQIQLRALQDDLDAQAVALQGARIRRRQG